MSAAPRLGPAAFLEDLRLAEVPVSVSGATEVQIGQGACTELRKRRPVGELIDELVRSVPVWTATDAAWLLTAARDRLCPDVPPE